MVKHIFFLRWLLIVSLIGIASYFLNEFGVVDEIWKTDTTFICAGIVSVFCLMSIWCGYKTYALKLLTLELYNQIKSQEKIGWFVADCFTTAGFVGTIWGMIVALKGFNGIDPSDIISIQKLISSLVHGVSIALYTTLTGLVCSLLLKLQYFNLGYVIERLKKREKVQ